MKIIGLQQLGGDHVYSIHISPFEHYDVVLKHYDVMLRISIDTCNFIHTPLSPYMELTDHV